MVALLRSSWVTDARVLAPQPLQAFDKGGSAKSGIEMPTVLVAVAIHLGWIALTWYHAALPLPVLAVLGGVIVAWHGSLQHETIHGHPTRHGWLNALIGAAPLTLWLPYGAYHRSHLAHHDTPHVTDPFDDPESHYLASSDGWVGKLMFLQSTLIGRLILGPPIAIARFAALEIRRAGQQPLQWARDWLPHLAALVPLFWWLDHTGLTVGVYLLAFVYPGVALSLLRSFAEHRADPDPRKRAAIVEQPGILGLLFLNNNLHAVHHAYPNMAWYHLPAQFCRLRHSFTAPGSMPFYQNYGEILRRFALRAQDDIVHPAYLTSEYGASKGRAKEMQ